MIWLKVVGIVENKVVNKFLSNGLDKFENLLNDLEECSHTLDGSKAILKNI